MSHCNFVFERVGNQIKSEEYKRVTLTGVVSGSDENLVVSKPGDDSDILADDRWHMTAHYGHVFSYHELVVHLHLIRLVNNCNKIKKGKK